MSQSSASSQSPSDRARCDQQALESRYAALIANSYDGIALLDAETRIVYANPAVERVLGYSLDEFIGLRGETLVHPGDLAETRRVVAVTPPGATFTIVNRMRHKDGRWRWIESRATNLLDDPLVAGVVVNYTDITAHRQADADILDVLAREQSARQQLEQTLDRMRRLQSVTAAFAAALTRADVAAVVVEHGIAALGARAGSLALLSDDRMYFEVAAHQGYEPGAMDRWNRFPVAAPTPLATAVQTKQSVWISANETCFNQYPDLMSADTRHRAWAAIPLIFNDTVLGGIALSFTAERAFDQDDQDFMQVLAYQCAQALERSRLYAAEQEARAAAQEALDLRDTFMSIASHELKNPLTSIVGYAYMLQRRLPQHVCVPPGDLRIVEAMVSQLGRMDLLINTLLDSSRIEAGQLDISCAPCDLAELVTRVVTEFSPTLSLHHVEYRRPAMPVMISGDALRLEQMLLNLLHNAVKYSPSGGPIEVQLQQGADRVYLSVSDRGIGIPESARARLFQRFFRADNSARLSIRGLGVGLYVAHEIVARHGGTIDVSSVEGVGSTFTVQLPALAPEQRAS